MLAYTMDSTRYKPGQIIKVYSKLSHISPVPIWHYGVVVGENDVVHFNLVAEEAEIRIIRTDLDRFINGGTQLQVCQISELNKTLSDEEVIARAISLEGSDFGGYNLLTNNCEHFANWCATGSRFSNQVPISEGEGHSIAEKVFENATAEPVLKCLDDITDGVDRLNKKTDEFFDWLGKSKFPWE